jgi:hypothetical protein
MSGVQESAVRLSRDPPLAPLSRISLCQIALRAGSCPRALHLLCTAKQVSEANRVDTKCFVPDMSIEAAIKSQT